MIHFPDFSIRSKLTAAFTLVEVMVAAGLASLLMVVLGFLSIYGARSFQALDNYAQLDSQSRNALDLISLEMRQGSALISFQTNLPNKSITLTNAALMRTMTINWNSDTQALTCAATGFPVTTLLTQCDSWDFSLYDRAPNITPTNIIFYPATNSAGVLEATRCKLVNMSWKCSRTILGSKINTESVQTAQIVLRNKVN